MSKKPKNKEEILPQFYHELAGVVGKYQDSIEVGDLLLVIQSLAFSLAAHSAPSPEQAADVLHQMLDFMSSAEDEDEDAPGEVPDDAKITL